MLHLLKTEWLVLSRSWIFWIISSLLIISMIVFPSFIFSRVDDASTRFQMLANAFSFPTVFNTMSVLQLLPFQLISIYFISLVCSGFETKTYHLHILSGKTKNELWLSKFSLGIIFCLISTFLVFILSLFFGFINDDEYVVIMNSNSAKWLLLFFIQTFAFISYGTTIGLIIKRTGPAILVYILWFGLFDRIIAHFMPHPLNDFFPGQSIEILTKLDVAKPFAIIHDELSPISKSLVATFWIIFSNIINILLYRKAKY
ncbi:MAG: hypothetical protein VB110_04895 [Bacteroidales bacterium]|nr:hypothetical protein [Bacteroidales bacterium]